MAIAEYSTGTFSPGATSTSWTGLDSSNTDDGIYQIFIDCANLAAGDVVEFRLLEKALSGGTERVLWVASLSNALAEPMVVTPSFVFLHSWTFEARQTTGTVRSFPWSIRQVA